MEAENKIDDFGLEAAKAIGRAVKKGAWGDLEKAWCCLYAPAQDNERILV